MARLIASSRRALLAAGALALGALPRRPGAAEPAALGFHELYRDGAFTTKLQELAGKAVAMRGFMAPPLKPEAGFFVLTRQPTLTCPFCDGEATWPPDIVVAYTGDAIRYLPYNVRLLVTGRLELGGFTDAEYGFFSRLRLVDADYRKA